MATQNFFISPRMHLWSVATAKTNFQRMNRTTFPT